jgi:hypothetical protein
MIVAAAIAFLTLLRIPETFRASLARGDAA